MSFRDEWPSMPSGGEYDGKQLFKLIKSDNSPFQSVWNVGLLIQEVEENLRTKVVDIPFVHKGSNNYGFHFKLSSQVDIVARVARGDVNMPDFDGFPIEVQAPEAEFEIATYQLLRSVPAVRVSRLLYSRIPVQHDGPKDVIPKDLVGRRTFIFERADGTNNVWEDLSFEGQIILLKQLASIRAALFNYNPPQDYAVRYLHERIFNFKSKDPPMAVAPTREYWIAEFKAKIEATIKGVGDMIGWEDDDEVVGPLATAAKASLLRVIPYILPAEDANNTFYRHVLEHGDFGIHNTSIATDVENEPFVTSLYDWETGHIVAAILSDPLVAAGPVDLSADESSKPAVMRLPKDPSPDNLDLYARWAQQYIEELYIQAPGYKSAIEAGKDARHLWYALRDWRGGNAEKFFGDLGVWAEEKFLELSTPPYSVVV